jgi:cytochrome c oxidase subunit 2
MKALFVLFVLLFAGCTQDTTEQETVKETTGNVVEINMTAKQFEFDPSTITVKKGDKVKLTITSTDVVHGFGLSAYGIDERVEPGEEVEIEFTADKAGEFTYVCTVYCGTGHNTMSGKLIVEE